MADPEYFTLAELRALPDMSDTTKYPEARCLSAAAKFVAIIEREVGTSFIARTVTSERHDGGDYEIALDHGYVQSVTSATEGGVAVTDTLVVDRGGVLLRMSSAGQRVRWASGRRNVAVTYQRGYSSSPPADIKEQAMQATRLHLMSTSSTNWANSRQTSLSTDMGVLGFVVAGSDRPTGYPELDAVIVGWRDRLNVLGFA